MKIPKIKNEEEAQTTSRCFTVLQLMFQEVNFSGLVPLLTMKGGEIEFVDIEVEDKAPAVDTMVRNLGLPDRSLLLAVLRDDELIFPRGDIVLRTGDHVIAATATNSVESLRQALVGEKTTEIED